MTLGMKRGRKNQTCEHALRQWGVGYDTDPQFFGFGQQALLLMLAIQQAELHLVACQQPPSILQAKQPLLGCCLHLQVQAGIHVHVTLRMSCTVPSLEGTAAPSRRASRSHTKTL